MLNDPLVTWNLLICVVAFPTLGWFIRREITSIHDAAKDRQSELKEEIRSIKTCISNIKEDVNEKVDKADCEKDTRDKWERLYHHRHTDSGEVVVTK